MLRKLRPRSVYDVMAAIGCFAALATGTAYAANTVFSTDIVDGEVKTADIGNGEVKSTDVKDESLTTFDVSTFLGADVVDGTLTGADIQNASLTADKLGTDVQPAVKFNAAPRSAFGSLDTPFVAGTRLRLLCTGFRLQVAFQNATGTPGTITASYLRGPGPTPTLNRVASGTGTNGDIWLDTFVNVGGSGNEGGAGTFVWTNGTRVVSGDFSYLADADHCEFYGTMHAGT